MTRGFPNFTQASFAAGLVNDLLLGLFVDLAPVTEHEYKYEDFFVLDLTDKAISTDTVLPTAGQIFP